MKTLYILRGLPGSGKSTLAKSLGGINIEADQYFMVDGKYEFDATKLSKAHNYCQCQTRAWMKMESDQISTDKIVVSNTFTTEKELEPYIELARLFDYRVVSLIVENRHGHESIHNVPVNIIDRMQERFKIKLR